MRDRAASGEQRAASGNALPLRGILVADFSRVLAGPLCTQMLGDFGARVIKVEEPKHGDETRRWGPPFVNGVSAYFLSINRHKESLAVDLREAPEVARRLIERADVVVDNFLPSQRAAFGLDRARQSNARVVHCMISGFEAGTDGEGLPGYDLLAQAGAGLMSITGEREGAPVKVGVALSDVLTAHYAFGAITAALLARERTGDGVSLEVSLFGSTAASLINVAQSALITGAEAGRFGNAHPSIVPYQAFEAADRTFVVAAGTDRHFRVLCTDVLERPDLADDARFTTNALRVENRGALIESLERMFRDRSADEWVARCRAAAVPAEIVRGVAEALRSESAAPLLAAMRHPDAGAYEAVAHPVRVDGGKLPAGSAPPRLGEHTESVLRELGFGDEEIAGVIAGRKP